MTQLTKMTETPASILASTDNPPAARLEHLEGIIQRWKDQFAEVGEALIIIHDERLFVPRYPTWIAYIKERWGIDRSHAWHLMETAKLVRALNDEGLPLPTREGHCRPLFKLPPEQRPEVWREITQQVPVRSVTTEVVNQLATERADPARKKAGGRYPARSLPPLSRETQEFLNRPLTEVFVGRVAVQQMLTVVVGDDGQFWCPQAHLRTHQGKQVRITVEYLP